MERIARAIVLSVKEYESDPDIERQIISWILQYGNPPVVIDAIARVLITEAYSVIRIIQDSLETSALMPPYDLLAKVREYRQAAMNRG